jgi:aryl-alcohol dehydrogenase-like predicted oxidoreductase
LLKSTADTYNSAGNVEPEPVEVMDRISTVGDGLEISRIIHGLWQVADQERLAKTTLELEKSAEAIQASAEAGYNTFDMADHCECL